MSQHTHISEVASASQILTACEHPSEHDRAADPGTRIVRPDMTEVCRTSLTPAEASRVLEGITGPFTGAIDVEARVRKAFA